MEKGLSSWQQAPLLQWQRVGAAHASSAQRQTCPPRNTAAPLPLPLKSHTPASRKEGERLSFQLIRQRHSKGLQRMMRVSPADQQLSQQEIILH